MAVVLADNDASGSLGPLQPLNPAASPTVVPFSRVDQAAQAGEVDSQTNSLLENMLDPQSMSAASAITNQLEGSGKSADEILAAAQDRMPTLERYETQMLRAGTVFRGVDEGLWGLGSIASLAMRGLSYIPGMENLADDANDYDRRSAAMAAVRGALSHQSSTAKLITPTGSDVLEGTIGFLTEMGGAKTAAGALTGEVPTGMEATKLMAGYYGLKRAERELTVGQDSGLSPEMRLGNAAMQGGIDALFALQFGKWAEQFGLSTAEQAMPAARPAINSLFTRTGLSTAMQSAGLQFGENFSMEMARGLWETYGTDQSDLNTTFERALRAGEIGAISRGILEVPKGLQNVYSSFLATQEALPDTVRGTLDAENAMNNGQTPEPPENESPEYKAAMQAHVDARQQTIDEINKTLAGIDVEESNLKDRVDAFVKARQDAQAAKDQPLPAAASDEEADAIRAQRDSIAQRRKDAEQALNDQKSWFDDLSKPDKQNIADQIKKAAERAQVKSEVANSAASLANATHAATDEFRQAWNLDEMPDSIKQAKLDALQQARSQGIPQRAEQLSNDVLATRRPLSSVQQTGIEDRIVSEVNLVRNQQARIDAGGLSDTEQQNAELAISDARKRVDLFTQALDISGSETGRTLVMRRFPLLDQLSPEMVVKTAARVKGSDLTDSEIASMEKTANDLQTKEDQLADMAKQKDSPDFDQKTYDSLDYQRSQLRAKLSSDIQDLQPKTFPQKLAGAVAGTDSVWRGLLVTLFRGPGILRQGLLTPMESLMALPVWRKALLDPEEAFVLNRNLRSDPDVQFSLASDTPIKLLEPGTPLSANEALGSENALLAAGNGIYAKLKNTIGAFERAQRTWLNTVRVQAMKAKLNAMGGREQVSSSEMGSINNFVNMATGSGDLMGFEDSSRSLSKIFLDPSWWARSVQYPLGWPMWKALYQGNNAVAGMMARTYAKQALGLATMGMVAEAAGKMAFGDSVQFHYDPFNDRDVGRLQIGSTMLDLSAGLATPFRYYQQFFGPQEMRDANAGVGSILQSHLAPLPSALVTGAQSLRGTLPPDSYATANYIVPWSLKRTYDALEAEGLPRGAAAGVLGMLGANGFESPNKRIGE